MTDLERAREALLKLSPIQAVTALVEAARREGGEEMREKAARLADGYCTDRTDDVARGIRALPLTPEEPQA